LSKRVMSLTSDLVARAHRDVTDSGPFAEYEYFDDQDYDDELERVLSGRPEGPFWLFAYGSLIWRPDLPVAEEKTGTARGWHRSFCMRMIRWRATKEQPGLMLALDEGGECDGILFRIAESDLRQSLATLLRREITAKPPSNLSTWIPVDTPDGPVRALAFVMNRTGDDYVGSLQPDEVALAIARACGHLGSNSEYLLNTVTYLEARGLHDPMLWRLQELVADELGKQPPG
jgi:glutathione-specific gamma-glutamylcyclotransferase